MFLDADGATDIKELPKILKDVKKVEKNGLACAIGNRNSNESRVEVILSQVTLYREKASENLFQLPNSSFNNLS